MNKLLKKFGTFSIGPIASAFVGFLTVPIITYFISPEEYGKASMFTLAQGVASMFVYLGLDQAFIREFNNYKSDLSKLLANAMVIPIVFSIILSVGIVAFRNPLSIFLFGNTGEMIAVYSLAILIPFMVIENFALLKIRMQEKGLQYSLFTITLKVFILATTVILFCVYEKSFRSVVYAMALGEIINSIIVFTTALRPLKLHKKGLDRALINRMLIFGVPLIPAMMMSWMLSSMDKVMIRIMCGYEELGLYSAAFKIVTILSIVQSCFSLFWTPVAYRWNEEKVDNNYYNIVNNIVAIIMSVMCLLLLIMKNVVGLVLGDSFVDAIRIFPFLLLYPIMYTMSESTAVGIGFSRKTYFSIVVSTVSCIVNLLLNYTLIPVFGATGAAMATGLSFVVFFWTRTIISHKIWWPFDMGFYCPIMFILLINCYLHTFLQGFAVYVISLISIIVVLLLNYKKIKNMYSLYKGK